MGAGKSKAYSGGYSVRGSAEFYDVVPPAAYLGACEACSGRFLGADELDLETVREYVDSSNFKGKTEIINELVEVGNKLFANKVTGNTTEEKIKSLIAIVPQGNQLASGDEKHKMACDRLAGAINRIHGSEIIAPGKPEVVCKQVVEVLSSLASGMHSEFLAVYRDVRTILKNLHALKDAMKETHDHAIEAAESNGEVSVKMRNMHELHNIITAEIDRQITMLTNLLNVKLMPADRDLGKLIADKKDLHGYIEKIDSKSGDNQFSKVISDVLKGLGLTASFAHIINDALKTVGMTISEYTATHSVRELRDKIVAGLMKQEMNEEQRRKYLDAADLLYKNLHRSEEIAKIGGASDNLEDHHNTAIDERVKNRRRLRNMIFETFFRQLGDLFDRFISSLDAMTIKVGSVIPITDALITFRQYLQRLDVELIRSRGIYYSLIGYYNDALSKQKKDSVMADLRHLSEQLAILEGGEGKEYFAEVRAPLMSIIAMIDKFSDEVAGKFGRGEVRGGDDDDDGSKLDSVEYLPEMKPVYRTTRTIHDAIRQFDYKCREASIKANLTESSKELSHYGEKYDGIVAESIADILRDAQVVYEKLRSQLDDKSIFGEDEKLVDATTTGFKDKKAVTAEREAAIAFLDAQWESKKKFWATVEAVDKYMRHFTDGLTKNPQDVKEIKAMLDGISIIGEWYNDRTGNNLAGVFEHFPSDLRGNGIVDADVTYPDASYSDPDGAHYYDRISAKLTAEKAAGGNIPNAYPGNPYLVTIPTKGKAAHDQCKQMMGSLSILKNLLSVFIHIGSKFGGEELRNQVFMRPNQMYNNLVDYVCASAFAQGFGLGKLDEQNLPEQFFSSGFMAVAVDMKDGKVTEHSTLDGAYTADTPAVAPAAAVKGKKIARPYTDVYGRMTSGIIHLGVTAKAGTSTIDQQYPEDALAKSLVGKINAATDELAYANSSVLQSRGPDGLDIVSNKYRQKWESSLSPVQKIQLFKKRWGIWMRSSMPGLIEQEGFSFAREDKYFVMILKALSAKILTVTSMYNLFDRPLEYNGLSPIRMILGGDSATPKIEEGVVPLCLRLTLLAEFYRGIFGFDEPNGDWNRDNSYSNIDNVKISMVPDVDGTFSGLIRLIFRRNKFVKGAQYSDDDMKDLIREINLIYTKMSPKYPKDIVMGTVREFVAEINRRYGIVSQKTATAFNTEYDYQYGYASRENELKGLRQPAAQIAILPGEGDEEYPQLSGAEKLLGEKLNSSKKDKKKKFIVSLKHKELLDKFRCVVDKYFEDSDEHEQMSFAHAIKDVQAKLRIETNDEARFKLVANLVRGVDVFSRVDNMKYVMFHETVVAGLNLLSATHSMLARFKKRACVINIKMLEDRIWTYLAGLDTNGKLAASNMPSLAKEISKYLCEDMGLAPKDDIEISNLVQSVLGANESANFNGGPNIIAPGAVDWRTKHTAVSIDRWPLTATASIDGNKKIKFGNAPALVAILNNFSAAELKAAYNDKETPANKAAKQAAETFMRFIFNREFIIRELVESLFGLSKDFQGLVDVRIENGRLFLSYGGVKTMVEEMFSQVQYFLDLLRPHIKADILSKYTDKMTAGSYYWLQEQLMEKLIIGRQNQKLSYSSLDEVMSSLSATYADLTREWSVDGASFTAIKPVVNASTDDTKQVKFDKVFAEMIFYDASRPQSGLVHSKSTWTAPSQESLGGLKMVDFMHGQYDQLHLAGAPGQKTLDTRYAARFHQLYSWDDEFTLNRSALFAFNQLIAKYIQTFYDPVSGKMYNGVINQFANGTFNRAIQDPLMTYPDTAPCVVVKYGGTGKYIAPTSQQVLSFVTNSQLSDQTELLVSLLKHLVAVPIPVATGIPDNRKTLDSTGVLSGFVNINAAGVTNVTTVYLYLLICILAEHIFNVVKAAEAVGASALIVAAGAAPAGLSAAAQAKWGIGWTNVDTTIKSLLTFSKADLIVILNNYTTHVPPPAAVRFTPLNGSVSGGYLTLVQSILVRGPIIGDTIVDAMRLYAFQSDCIGQDDADTTMRLRLFAALVIALTDAYINAPSTAVYERAKIPIRQAASGIQEVANGPMVAQPKITAKYDDLIIANADISAANVYPKGESSFILLARSQEIPGYLSAGSISSGILILNGGKTKDPSSDDLANIVNFGQRADPDANHVLFSSLANIIRNLVMTRANNQTPVYLQENVADIAMYMKEKMRANLPGFRNLFKELATRCEFIKVFLNQRELDLTRLYAVAPVHNPWPYVLEKVTTGSDETKNRFTEILDAVIRGCTSLIAGCNDTLREIGDDPKYFEMFQNSIKEYRGQHGTDPFMPLSSSMVVLRNTNSENQSDMLPIFSLGQPQFKFAYGLRSLLGQPATAPLLEHVPGFDGVINGFNITADGKLQIDRARAEGFLKVFVKMLRYVNELKNVKGLLTPYVQLSVTGSTNPNMIKTDTAQATGLFRNGMFTRDDLVLDSKYDGNTRVASAPTADFRVGTAPVDLTQRADLSISTYAKPVFAVSHLPVESLKMTESSFKDDKIRDLVKYLSGSSPKHTSMEVQNIIDLDIVPINVHALMREIPLVNLYNYSYTFDRLVIELYYGLKKDAHAQALITDLCGNSDLTKINSAKDMLVALLLNPYKPLQNGDVAMNTEHNSLELYNNHTRRMLSGAGSDAHLGRPKFLSDQIFNKAVFGKLYNTEEDYNESGPGAVQYQKLSVNAGIEIIAKLMALVMLTETGNTHKHPRFLDAGTGILDLLPFTRGIARFMNEHPIGDFNNLELAIQHQMSDPASNVNKVRGAGTTTKTAFARICATIAHMSYVPIAHLVNVSEAIGALREEDIYNAGIHFADLIIGIDKLSTNNVDAIMKTSSHPLHPKSTDGKILSLIRSTFTLLKNIALIDASNNTSFSHGDAASLCISVINASVSITDKNGKNVIRNPENLTYIKDDQVMSKDVSEIKQILAAVGRLRFDTIFIRNLTFIVNLYRTIRMKLQMDLNYSRDIVMKSEPITRSGLTEFYGNESEMEFDRNYKDSNMWKKYDF